MASSCCSPVMATSEEFRVDQPANLLLVSPLSPKLCPDLGLEGYQGDISTCFDSDLGALDLTLSRGFASLDSAPAPAPAPAPASATHSTPASASALTPVGRARPPCPPDLKEAESLFPGFSMAGLGGDTGGFRALTPGSTARKLGPPRRMALVHNNSPALGVARRVLAEDTKEAKSRKDQKVKDCQEDVLCNLFSQSVSIRNDQKLTRPTPKTVAKEKLPGGISTKDAMGSVQRLTPVRPNKEQKDTLGCAYQVLTPVRRSARKLPKAKSELVAVDVMLEATNFSYVPNEALAESHVRTNRASMPDKHNEVKKLEF